MLLSLRSTLRAPVLATVLAAAVCLTVAASPASGQEPVPSTPATSWSAPAPTSDIEQSQLGAGAAWSWFSDPRSVFLPSPKPRTYTGWIDSSGRIVVSALDHTTNLVSWTTVMDFFFVDDHNNPTLLAHPDGNLSVFWSGHNESAIWIRTTTRPGDLTSFGPLRAIRSFAGADKVVTYTNPVLLPGEGNRIYLFFRSGYTHQAYVTSDDGGQTWSRARVVVEQPNARPYVKYDTDGNRTIALAFTDGHPDERRTSLYYAEMRGGQFLRADGSVIKSQADGPLVPSEGDLLWSASATGTSAWVHDVGLDAAGNPTVVFATIRSAEDHRYHYARHDGLRWTVQELAAAGGSIATAGRERSYSGGITLDHADPSTVYLSRPSVAGPVHEIERWRTPDAGTSWMAEAVTSGSSAPSVRPVRPRGLPADAGLQAIWMNGAYPHFTTFRTSLYGTGRYERGVAGTTGMRISATALTVIKGGAVTIRGRFVQTGSGAGIGGEEAVLVSRPVGLSTWRRVDQKRTASDGLVAFMVRVAASTEYAVVFSGDDRWSRASSPAVQIKAVPAPTAIRTSLGPARPVIGQPFTLSARLVRSTDGAWLPGRKVTLLGRRVGATAWSTLLTGATTREGLVHFRRGLMAPTEYAVQYAGDAATRASRSAVVRLPRP